MSEGNFTEIVQNFKIELYFSFYVKFLKRLTCRYHPIRRNSGVLSSAGPIRRGGGAEGAICPGPPV